MLDTPEAPVRASQPAPHPAAHALSEIRRDGAGHGPHEFLTFDLGEERYGIDILKVQEIRRYDAVTRIANTPDFLKGVINLRGTIVPVADMRIKFRLGEPAYNDFTVMIVLNVGRRVIGIVVDAVSDVIALDEADIHPAPRLSASMDTRYVRGIGNADDRMIILVDIEELLGSSDMGLFDATAGTA